MVGTIRSVVEEEEDGDEEEVEVEVEVVEVEVEEAPVMGQPLLSPPSAVLLKQWSGAGHEGRHRGRRRRSRPVAAAD